MGIQVMLHLGHRQAMKSREGKKKPNTIDYSKIMIKIFLKKGKKERNVPEKFLKNCRSLLVGYNEALSLKDIFTFSVFSNDRVPVLDISTSHISCVNNQSF